MTTGSSQTSAASCRLTVFMAVAGLGFGGTPGINSSLTPTVASVINRKLYEKRFQVSGQANVGLATFFPTTIELDLPLKGVHGKYNGTGSNVQTGEVLYIILESNLATGTGSPKVDSGVVELFFTDT